MLLKIIASFLLVTLAESQSRPSISENTLPSAFQDLTYCGQTQFDPEDPKRDLTRYQLVLSKSGNVFLSSDNGVTIQDISKQFEAAALKKKKVLEPSDTHILKTYISKFNQTHVYFLGMQEISYFSDDCGQSLIAFEHHITVTSFELSANSGHVLSKSLILCDSGDSCPTLYNIYISEDNGQSWKLMLPWAQQITWDVQKNLSSNAKKHSNFWSYMTPNKDRLLASHYVHKEGKECSWIAIRSGDCTLKLNFSDDYFKNTSSIYPEGMQFHKTDHYLFLLKEEDQKVKLMISNVIYGGMYHFVPILLQDNSIKDHGYTILEAKHGIVVLNINHVGNQANDGNIYISDYSGQRFSLSLEGNARSPEGFSDFIKIQSMEGVYIANIIQNGQKKTVITYNQGGSWKSLKAPNVDCLGKKVVCELCTLHLIGFIDSQGTSIHSDPDNKGLIIGLGNIGKFLNMDNINTYLSNDGGQTWIEIKKGRHVFQIGDHGGVIILAKDQELTNEIYFSWDYGKSFETLQLKNSMIVDNILFDNEISTQSFQIIGKKSDDLGTVVSIDFNTINERVCKGFADAGRPNSDYEIWVPNHDQCILGGQTMIYRRKADARCWNDYVVDKEKYIKPCDCTEDDWECEYGFHRDETSNACLPVDPKYKIVSTKPDPCFGWYYESTEYKKSPGNMCTNGVDKGPKKIFCSTEDKAKELSFNITQSRNKEIFDIVDQNIVIPKAYEVPNMPQVVEPIKNAQPLIQKAAIAKQQKQKKIESLNNLRDYFKSTKQTHKIIQAKGIDFKLKEEETEEKDMMMYYVLIAFLVFLFGVAFCFQSQIKNLFAGSNQIHQKSNDVNARYKPLQNVI